MINRFIPRSANPEALTASIQRTILFVPIKFQPLLLMLKTIHKTTDQYGTIEVLDDGAKRYLTFGNDHEQSLQIKASPHIPQHEYSRAIMMVLLFVQPQSVCILGLGGGTMALAFLNALKQPDTSPDTHINPHTRPHISAVELRPSVVKIAHHYFQLGKYENLSIHKQDAAVFLEHSTEKYDVLIADMYHHHGIDEAQLKNDFIKKCAHSVSHDGWLVLNYWLDHDINDAILSPLFEHFEHIFVCNSGGGNKILYAGREKPKNDYLDAKCIKPLAKKLGFSLNYYLKRLQVLVAK